VGTFQKEPKMSKAKNEQKGSEEEQKQEVSSEDVAPLTLEEYRSWTKERQQGLQAAVSAGLALGKSYDDTVPWEGQKYMIGYVKQFIDLVEAEEIEAEVENEKSAA
jgi:fibrillarin-like rRNA methylase